MNNFYQLNDTIPYVSEGDKHSQVIQFDDVRIAQPGKYKDITDGGDFVVDTQIGDKWVPLRHADYFNIVQQMVDADPEWMRNKFGPALVMASKGMLDYEDIDKIPGGPIAKTHGGVVHPRLLLRTLMLITVAEHRRAPWAEPVGGRFLIVRFLLGIVYGNWTAGDAVSFIREGKPGLKKVRWHNSSEPTFSEVLG